MSARFRYGPANPFFLRLANVSAVPSPAVAVLIGQNPTETGRFLLVAAVLAVVAVIGWPLAAGTPLRDPVVGPYSIAALSLYLIPIVLAAVQAYRNDGILVSWLLATAPVTALSLVLSVDLGLYVAVYRATWATITVGFLFGLIGFVAGRTALRVRRHRGATPADPVRDPDTTGVPSYGPRSYAQAMGADTPANYAAELRAERSRKDEFFRDHPKSPIPAEDRPGFDGLRYFDPDPNYRLELDLHEHDEVTELRVETTQDGEQTYLRWGEFRFEADGVETSLQAYKPSPEADRLWVPFRDATSGEETYGAGRYLDLEDPDDRTDDGKWILDFNRAYSPYCAYSDAYECPLVPSENHLDVPIRAGEKTPALSSTRD